MNKSKQASPKSKQSFEGQGRAVFARLANATQLFFLRHLHMLQILLLLIAAAVSGWVVWEFLFTEAELPPEIASPREEHLDVPLVNELELWIEDRQTAYESIPSIPAAPLE